MVTQVPTEIQAKLKDWVRPKDEALSAEDALGFGPVLRRLLEEKGIPIDRGCAVVDQDDQEETVNKQGGPSGDSREASEVCVVTGKNYRNYGKNPIRNCYSCGVQIILFVPVLTGSALGVVRVDTNRWTALVLREEVEGIGGQGSTS